MTQPSSQAQPSRTGQKERVPTKQPYLEASDPWKTTNTQQLSAREKLAQIQQQAQPTPGSAREKLAQQKQTQQQKQQAKPAPQSARAKLTQQQAQRPSNQKTQQQQKHQGIER